MTPLVPEYLVAFEAPNLLISSYPLVMVATFAVPLASCSMAWFCGGSSGRAPRQAG